MRRNQVAVVGAAETTKLGVIPDVSQIQLHADAALNALADCGPDDQGHRRRCHRGRAAAADLSLPRHHPDLGRRHLVGGCSFMLHVRHAAAAIKAGLCKTVLITHAESGKSNIGRRAARRQRGKPERPVRKSVRPGRAAIDVHDPRAALPQDPRHHRRADWRWSPWCSASGRRRIRAPP